MAFPTEQSCPGITVLCEVKKERKKERERRERKKNERGDTKGFSSSTHTLPCAMAKSTMYDPRYCRRSFTDLCLIINKIYLEYEVEGKE